MARPNPTEDELKQMIQRGGAREHGKERMGRPVSRTTEPKRAVAARTLEPKPASAPHIQQFFVPGLLPGQNTFMGNGTHWKYGAAKRLWMGFIRRAIHHAKLTPMQRVQIAWEWRERNRMRDPDNFTGINKKFILDTLVEVGILPDDGWDEIAGWTDRWHVDASNPGVLVTLTEAP